MNRLALYWRLIRMDKPIGILLLLWPTLWGLWLAARGMPSLTVLGVFVAGTVLMRSAGCAINDFADRDFDKHVKRTAQRPVTSGQIKPVEAVWVAVVLALVAGGLVLLLDPLVWWYSLPAVVLAGTYPFMKRFFALPQAYLGVAFGFGIPMAFAAVQGQVPLLAWQLLLANVFWTLAYDTEYAMVDREDDLKIGIRTAAITFGEYDVVAVMACYATSLLLLAWIGVHASLPGPYFAGLLAAALRVGYHFALIRHRDPARCFRAFLDNNTVGLCIFAGLLVSFL